MLTVLAKKTHKTLFKNVLKQVISANNKVHMQNNVFDYTNVKDYIKNYLIMCLLN